MKDTNGWINIEIELFLKRRLISLGKFSDFESYYVY